MERDRAARLHHGLCALVSGGARALARVEVQLRSGAAGLDRLHRGPAAGGVGLWGSPALLPARAEARERPGGGPWAGRGGRGMCPGQGLLQPPGAEEDGEGPGRRDAAAAGVCLAVAGGSGEGEGVGEGGGRTDGRADGQTDSGGGRGRGRGGSSTEMPFPPPPPPPLLQRPC